MSDLVKRLKERRGNIWDQAQKFLDQIEADVVKDENRQWSAEEEETWKRFNDDIKLIDERVQELVESEERKANAEKAFSALLEKAPEAKAAEKPDGEEAQLRAFLRGDTGRFYEIRRPERRDLVKGTDTAGGNTVPISFYNRLVEHLIEVSGVMQCGPTELTTDSGEELQIPKTTAHSSSAGIVAEADAIPENDPTFGQVSLGAYKYGFLLQLSRELIEDTGVDLLGYIARQAGRAVGNGVGAHLVTGTGTSQPQGVVTGSTLGVTSATAVSGRPSYDNLVDLLYSVIAPYRASRSCCWLMRDATVGEIRKIKDADGNPIWQPGMQANEPDLLFGKRIVTDPNVAAVATSAKSIVFGDFSTYFVRRVNAIRFERSDDFAFANDLVTYRILVRADGRQVDTSGALKHFIGAAT